MTDTSSYPVSVPQRASTPPPPLRLLTRDTPSDYLTNAAQVLYDAFANDQLFRILNDAVPGLTLARLIRTVTTGTLDLETYVVEDGGILGVMVVQPPGRGETRCVSCVHIHVQVETRLGGS